MEFFSKTKFVKLRSHLDKYLVADENKEIVRQSKNGASDKATWQVEYVENNPHVIRLKSHLGNYLTASDEPFLLGMTGNRVLHKFLDNKNDLTIDWHAIRDGFQVKLKSYGGTYLRANGGTPPWRNSVTHDGFPAGSKSKSWVLWFVESVDHRPGIETVTDYLSTVSSFSSVPDEHSGSVIGSPESVEFSLYYSPATPPSYRRRKTGMELFNNATAVRLRSHHDKYLYAEEDEESVSQDRNGSSKKSRWAVEFVGGKSDENSFIRLKSFCGKYLTASNHPFLLGMTGRKVLQTMPNRLDSSVEWEPIREGNQVKLKTRYGHFLRGNGGLPPWRNSVTHDIPHRTATQDWIVWDVDVVEILVQSPIPKPAPKLPVAHSDSFGSESPLHFTNSTNSTSFSRQESSDSHTSPPKAAEGRMIHYHIADENDDVDESVDDGHSITFKGNGVEELTQRLEEETGLKDIVVCSRSPLNGKLYPLRLQLPPNNVTMHVVLVQSQQKE